VPPEHEPRGPGPRPHTAEQRKPRQPSESRVQISNRSLNHLAWGLLLGVAGSVIFAVVADIGYLPPPSFYEASAQIGPVLLVALAVEGSARAVWDEGPALLRWLLIVSLLAGEIVAIVAASGVIAADPLSSSSISEVLVGPSQTASEVMAGVTAAGLGVGFIAVTAVALYRPRRQRRPSASQTSGHQSGHQTERN
jgi:hypothetical protein